MAERTIFPEWRKQNETTKYPFSARASLVNSANRVVVEGTFLDAALYPVGAGEGLFLSRAVITHQDVTLYVGDPSNRTLAHGTVPLVNAPDLLTLEDRKSVV